MKLDPNIPALSVRAWWAECIIRRLKPVENRVRRTHYRGKFYIHASSYWRVDGVDQFIEFINGLPSNLHSSCFEIKENVQAGELNFGGIIGVAELVDCVTEHDSPWFTGPYGWVIANPNPLQFIPCKGRLGFFKPQIEV